MVALAELVEPGSSPSSDSSPTGRRPEGSPAPWDPRAGELLDEICRGALRLEASARTWLRLSAARHGSADLVVRGQSAVVALPQLVEWVEARHPEHPLVRGASLSARHPERGHRPGEIEAWLRSVHRRSVELVTGSSPPRGCCRRCPTRSRSSGGCVGRDHRSVMTVSRRSSSSVTTCLVCGRHTLAWGRSCRCGARSVGTGAD